MATTLQKQLAAIAVSTTHELDLKAQKSAHAKSLLFETRIAASQSFEVIYLICHEGFRELCTIDPRFLAFSANLFSEQSKIEDRTQMTHAENESLDEVLEAFMTLVGPRILLKPAEKALEWLVRRFRIHEYNTQYLVFTYLPYFNTPQFLALLSILPSHLPSLLRFLSPYTESPTNPPRRAIVYTAINTPAFFDALQSHLVKVVQAGYQRSQLLSFWSSTTIEAIFGILDCTTSGRRQIQDQKTEELVLRMLPIFDSCMQIQHGAETVAACYTIVIVLVTQARLGDKVLDGLAEAVFLAHDEESTVECLACLAVLARKRSGVTIPTEITRRIVQLPQISEKLQLLSKQCQVERLALSCALYVLHSNGSWEQNQSIFHSLIKSQLFSKSSTEFILTALIQLLHSVVPGSDQQRELSCIAEKLTESTQLRDLLLKLAKDAQIDLNSLGFTFQQSSQIDRAYSEVDEEEQAEGQLSDPPVQLKIPDVSVSSFLDPQTDINFDDINEIFEQAVTSKQLKQFLASESIGGENALQNTTYISFLIQIWCGPRSVPVRVAALKAATTTMTNAESANELQHVIPYLIYALADSSSPVRRAAASCIAMLSSKSKDSECKPWGSLDMYGNDSRRIQALNEMDLRKLFTSILDLILEECIMDPGFVIGAIQGILEGVSDLHTKQRHIMKDKSRLSILTFLLSHAILTPQLRVRLCLLPIFSLRGKILDNPRINMLLPAIRKWCTLSAADAVNHCTNAKLAVEDVERGQLNALIARDTNSINLLQQLISGLAKDRTVLTNVAFERISKLWFSMKSESKLLLAQQLLDLSSKNSDDALSVIGRERALETLRNVKLSPTIFECFLEKLVPSTKSAEGPPPKKKRRTSTSELAGTDVASSEDNSVLLRKLTLVLELIESKSPGIRPALFKSLFNVFSYLQTLQQESESGLAYLQVMTLSSLAAMTGTMKGQANAIEYQSVVRVDLIVDCIRQSSSPQIQNNALLLIANLASWVPDLVLHNLMPIFTFVGSTLVRQQDEYSAHIVDKTISQVVPQLATSLRQNCVNFLSGISDLLLSFTTAFEHIPLHRRLKLFSELARTLGPKDSLPAIIALLADRYGNGKTQRRFSVDLLLVFNPIEALATFKGYMDLTIDAAGYKSNVSITFFNMKEKSHVQKELTLRNLLLCLADLVSDERMRNQVTRVFRQKEDISRSREFFAKTIELIIQLSKKIASSPKLYETCGRMLSKFLDLLPTADLVQSVQLLLSNSDVQVQTAAIKSIELRAGSNLQSERRSVPALLSFVPHLDYFMRQSQDTEAKIISISCIDRIIEKFGKKDMNTVLSVVSTISGPQSLSHSDDRVRILSLLCLSSIVDVVEDEAIPLLPSAVPTALDHLSHAIEEKKIGLHNAVYAFLSNIVERLGYMLSEEDLKTALTLSYRSSVARLDDSCDESRHAFHRSVSGHIDAQVAFTALGATWHSAVATGVQAAMEHLDLLRSIIDVQTKGKLIKAYSHLCEHLLQIFQVTMVGIGNELEEIEEPEPGLVESAIVESVIAMVFKVNDTIFRPFFIRLVDQEGPRHNPLFFKFLAAFFDKFKSIVTSYASYTIEHMANSLSVLAQNDDKPELRSAVLNALQKSFDHDQDGFWQSSSHFTKILSPLVSLLELSWSSSSSSSSSHTPARPSPDTHSTQPSPFSPLISTITSLAHCTSTSSSTHHHDLNVQLLRLLRSPAPSTRLATVLCEQALTMKLGEEWLALLPEMLPIIAELREDDDEVVERETLRWISSMEDVLGESLEGMLQ